MKIAIHAADLDAKRIDGTRVYILNLLRRFGELSSEDEFFIYHRRQFNPELAPPEFSNYRIKKTKFPFFWTQTAFASEVVRDRPDVLWMPVHNIPFFRRSGLKTVITIHDLAFKYFPDFFLPNDLRKLNFFTDRAVRKSSKIIAVSGSTKKDILKFYPDIASEKIKVIYHGFDAEIFQKKISREEIEKILKNHNLKIKDYVLYSGAFQPRKNLERLIEAFEIYKQKKPSETKLVLAGEKAWLWEKIMAKIAKSRFKKDIVMPGKLKFHDLGCFMQGANVFVYPSLYEGFGIPVLEALAAEIPVIAALNSSLSEVGGAAVCYFQAENSAELAERISETFGNEELRKTMIAEGLKQCRKFSWKKCAQETLNYLKS